MISYNHPVILIEGLDGVGKSTLVRALATHLGATVIASPPNMPDPGDTSRDLRLRMDRSRRVHGGSITVLRIFMHLC